MNGVIITITCSSLPSVYKFIGRVILYKDFVLNVKLAYNKLSPLGRIQSMSL